MALKSDGPTYTHIQCPRCGRQKTINTYELNGMFRDHGVKVEHWSFDWFGKRMRCSRCGTKGMVLSGR